MTENDSRADRNLLTTFAILPPAIGRTRVDAERQNPRGRFGSSPFVGATCKPPPPLRSSRLVRTDFSPVLIYMRPHAHTDSCPPKSPCAVEAMIVFGPSLPEKPYHFSSQLLFWQGTAAFWLAAVSAQNPHQKKIICGRRNIRTSFCPLVIVEAILAGRLAPVEHTDSGTDLRDSSELADNIQDSATGDLALVWLQGC